MQAYWPVARLAQTSNRSIWWQGVCAVLFSVLFSAGAFAASVGNTVQVTAAGGGAAMRTGAGTSYPSVGTTLSVGMGGVVQAVTLAGGYEWLQVAWTTGTTAWSASGPSGSPGAWIAVVAAATPIVNNVNPTSMIANNTLQTLTITGRDRKSVV